MARTKQTGLDFLGALDVPNTYMVRGAAIGGAVAVAASALLAPARHPLGFVSYLIRGLVGAGVGAGAGYSVARWGSK